MSLNNKITKHQKSVLIGILLSGLVFIFLAVMPELFFSAGQAGFGRIQLFFIRIGIFLSITSLILLFSPGSVNYITNAFSNNDYQSERSNYVTSRNLLKKFDLILLFFFLFAGNLFTIYFIGKENVIYDWDAAHFWTKYIEISDKFRNSPLNALRSVMASIQYDEYNYFAPFFLIPFSLLFGTERLPYILSVFNMFGSLSALSYLFLYKRFAVIKYGKDRLPYDALFMTLFIFFSFPFFWTPILFGYVDLVGFFVICLILYYFFKYPLSVQKYGTLLIIGILLPTLILLRRWYSCWTISFFIALIINESIFLYADYRFDRKRLIVTAKKISFIVFTSGVFFLIVAGPRLWQMVSTDYSYLAVAYNPYNTLQHFKRFLSDFGPIYPALAFSGLLLSFCHKNTRKLASFLFIQWVLSFVIFTRISFFVYHHYYLLQPTMLLLISLLMTTLLIKTKSKTIRVGICSVYILASMVIFTVVFVPRASSYANQAKGLFPNTRYYPLVRNDIDEIKRMLNILGGLLTNPSDQVYVLAGSETLNSDHVEKAHMSLKDTPDMAGHIFRTNDLDLRDGFPTNLFKAKYVIVADPIQCDLGCNKQRVISAPADFILKGENMGASYKRLPYEFALEKKVRAYIYERTTASSVKTDMDSLSDALQGYYPDKPFVYKTE